MTDLDQRIASVLRERAEGEIDTHRLLRGSRARGRRRQLRRRVAAGTALALVGVLGFAGVTATDANRLPWTAATPRVVAPVPPRVDGVPGAAQRPDLVGTDPQVLHLGVDPSRARYLRWAVHSSNRVESIQLSVGGGRPVLVEVSGSAEAIDEFLLDGVPIQEAVIPLTFDGAVQEFGVRPAGWSRPGSPFPACTPGRARSAATGAPSPRPWTPSAGTRHDGARRRCG